MKNDKNYENIREEWCSECGYWIVLENCRECVFNTLCKID